MKRRILITGGCGFIGTNATLYFQKKGDDIFIVDNFSRPGSEYNADFLRQKGISSIIQLDIAINPESLNQYIDTNAIDVVIHAAAQVAVTTSIEEPLLDFSTNVMGTMHVLEAARRAKKMPHVLFTSTNKVYGGLENLPVEVGENRYRYFPKNEGVSEETPLDFHTPYGCSKGAADQYVRDYSRTYHLPTTVFRQSCIYGKHQFGMVDQGWISYITMRAVFDKPITIYGDGKQVRDILYVEDLILAMERAIESSEHSNGEIFNIGGGSQHTLSLLELIAFLQRRLKKDLTIIFSDWRSGDQKVYISDTRKIQEKLQWSPSTAFIEGFEEMLLWIQENKAILKKFI